MIEELSVKGLAVVEEARIAFGPGLNAVTGETGAGKSVLLSAIGLVAGARADREAVRAGCERADVTARVRLPPQSLRVIAPILEECGIDPCEDGELILRRTVGANGAGRCFANGCPATVQTLHRIGERLVDFHGPHDNQSLLSPGFQLEALDSFGGCEELLARYAEAFGAWRSLVRRREALEAESGGTVAREIDLLRYQVGEIDEAGLDPEADGEALRAEWAEADNAARIQELGSVSCAALSEGEGCAVDSVAAAVRALEQMSAISSRDAAEWLERARTLSSGISDLSLDISSALSRFDASPERLATLEARISLVETLRHKYGRTVEDVLAFRDKAAERLAALEGRGEELAAIGGAMDEAFAKVEERGRALSARRAEAASRLARAVVAELSDLGLPRCGFEVGVSPAKPCETGCDEVSFGFAPNPGEPVRPLRLVASSGEISRVMLALKTVLAAHDKVPVLVFDEIDANVGGETARVVGRKLAALGASRQVLCITHLPQVASCAATHFSVRKSVDPDGRTRTSIDRIEGGKRVDEIARMLGGENLTSVARRHAEELLVVESGA